jgi:nucleoside triphosphate pyrophosphatase
VSLILASTSPIRRRLLANAGIAAECVPPITDEAELRRALPPDCPPAAVAESLAAAKALSVSTRRPAAHVIGADQVLVLDGAILAKPADLSDAHRRLAMLRGRTHRLVSSLVLARDDRRLAVITDSADLTMRDFTDSFLDRYLAAVGPEITSSVGAYRLEDEGVQLFERIAGDYFTILGLPLLPLLSVLRAERLIPS